VRVYVCFGKEPPAEEEDVVTSLSSYVYTWATVDPHSDQDKAEAFICLCPSEHTSEIVLVVQRC
jgi:hypothetical protein